MPCQVNAWHPAAREYDRYSRDKWEGNLHVYFLVEG